MAPNDEQTQAAADPVAPTKEGPPAAQPTTKSGEAHDEEGPVGMTTGLKAPTTSSMSDALVEGEAKATGRA